MNGKMLTIGLGALALMAGGGCAGNDKGSPGVLGSQVARDEADGPDEDVVVRLDQVPDAVRATILAHTDAGAVTKIELDTEHGVSIYSAKTTGGQELNVAADGTFLGSEADDGDDGDGDGEEYDD